MVLRQNKVRATGNGLMQICIHDEADLEPVQYQYMALVFGTQIIWYFST